MGGDHAAFPKIFGSNSDFETPSADSNAAARFGEIPRLPVSMWQIIASPTPTNSPSALRVSPAASRLCLTRLPVSIR